MSFNEEMSPVENTYWETFCWLKAGWIEMNYRNPFAAMMQRTILSEYLSNPEVQSKIKLLGMCYRELEAEGKWQG